MNVAVVGVGLIGGSIALAARDRLAADVRESDPAGGMSVAQALDGADVAFVAAPLGVLGDVIDEVLAAAPPDCVVSDVGSVTVVEPDASNPAISTHVFTCALATGIS